MVNGCQGEINGSHTFNSLIIQNNSVLIHGSTLSMSLTINTNVTIESGSAIDLSRRGYAGGTAGYDPGDGPGGALSVDRPFQLHWRRRRARRQRRRSP